MRYNLAGRKRASAVSSVRVAPPFLVFVSDAFVIYLMLSYPSISSISTHRRTDLEKYSDQAWVLRYRKERDAALRAHRRQYRRRQILSKFGLARAPVSNEYERFMDVDREKEWDQEERRGWVKRRSRPPSPIAGGKGGKKAANRR